MTALDLDYDALRHYADKNISDLPFVTVRGAHLYGFPSPDSDVDLRGSFAAPLANVLGLDAPRETLETAGIIGGVEVEMVGHEIAKHLRLLVKPNGYYAGFARGEWRDYQKVGVGKTIKRLLYLHRVLMTGIVLLTEGVTEANLHRLNERFGLRLDPLLAMKTREQADVEGDDAAFTQAVGGLFGRLDEARESSPLPEDVPNRAALNEFIIRLRLFGVGQRS